MTRSMGTTKMGEILEALREVRENLDRRASRAYGALLMVWGATGALIFGFYQLVTWNPAPYRAALGPWLEWVWLAPTAIGYAASAVVGARLGRLAGAGTEVRNIVATGIGVSVGIALVLILFWFGQFDRIPGTWLIVLSATVATRLRREPGPRGLYRATSVTLAVVAAAVGLWVLLAPFPLANAAAAAVFLVGCGTLGTMRYLGAG